MGLIDDLKKWAHPYEDEDEEYEDDFAELGSRDTGAFAAATLLKLSGPAAASATATRTAATRSSTSTRRRSSRSCSSSPSALRMPARSPTT